MQRVGLWADKKDHHPEWTVEDGGRTVSVHLTSHFAGNKVTLFDFELAEQMNRDYKITTKTFRLYPFMSNRQWSSILIFVGTYLFIMTGIRFIRTIMIETGSTNSEFIRNGRVEIAKPYVIGTFQLDPKIVKGARNENDINKYVEKNVDDFTLHTKLYRPGGLF